MATRKHLLLTSFGTPTNRSPYKRNIRAVAVHDIDIIMERLLAHLDEQPAYHAYVARLRALGYDNDEIAARLTRLTVETMRRVKNRIN
jgi:hypothetical protein